eukprot:9424859-Pyramimonas_sp.AAC.1
MRNRNQDDDFEAPASAPAPAPKPKAQAPAAKGTKRAAPTSAQARPEAKSQRAAYTPLLDRRRVAGGAGVSGTHNAPAGAPQNVESKPIVSTSSDGTMWEIASMRRVKVDKFKGKVMVSIREFYTVSMVQPSPSQTL